MQASRAQFDADRTESPNKYTKLPTETNRFELNCGICNRILYVDEQTRTSAYRAMAEGLDNPLICDECRDEYGELEHGGH